jgi:hypothetical protein
MFSFFDSLLLFSTILFHSVILGNALPITFASPVLQRDTLESLFRYEDYTEFQIGGGVGGNALEEARSIFEGESRFKTGRDETSSLSMRLITP